MKVVILAGGFGTRFAEETVSKPKPMITIGGHPILWHIMKHFSHYGFTEFIIALGYMGEVIKQYFIDYYTFESNLTITLQDGFIQPHKKKREDWIVHLVDTGIATHTAGRVKRLQPFLKDETFFLTYGDGVSNIDLHKVVATHQMHNRIATISVVRPPSRYGIVRFKDGIVNSFTEKSVIDDLWINGGYMVFNPAIMDYIKGDQDDLAHDTLENLAKDGQLAGYQHDDFWQGMDNIRDKRYLEQLWSQDNPVWKLWK